MKYLNRYILKISILVSFSLFFNNCSFEISKNNGKIEEKDPIHFTLESKYENSTYAIREVINAKLGKWVHAFAEKSYEIDTALTRTNMEGKPMEKPFEPYYKNHIIKKKKNLISIKQKLFEKKRIKDNLEKKEDKNADEENDLKKIKIEFHTEFNDLQNIEKKITTSVFSIKKETSIDKNACTHMNYAAAALTFLKEKTLISYLIKYESENSTNGHSEDQIFQTIRLAIKDSKWLDKMKSADKVVLSLHTYFSKCKKELREKRSCESKSHELREEVNNLLKSPTNKSQENGKFHITTTYHFVYGDLVGIDPYFEQERFCYSKRFIEDFNQYIFLSHNSELFRKTKSALTEN